MPAGGTLRLAARNRTILPRDVRAAPELRPGRWVEIVVSDTGTGMSPDVQARVFEPFFTTKAQGKGIGLGLSTVHGFVHQSGGFVTLTSTPGHGSSFTVYLPSAAATAAARPGQRAEAVVRP
jgi:signal transduction histidine kinase